MQQLELIPDRKRTALIFVQTRPDLFRSEFATWLAENFIVWTYFEREANRAWDYGYRHYSARRIGEWLRHQTALREAPNEFQFKLNDHYWPDLARLYSCHYPERRDFFEFRVGQSAVRAA